MKNYLYSLVIVVKHEEGSGTILSHGNADFENIILNLTKSKTSIPENRRGKIDTLRCLISSHDNSESEDFFIGNHKKIDNALNELILQIRQKIIL